MAVQSTIGCSAPCQLERGEGTSSSCCGSRAEPRLLHDAAAAAADRCMHLPARCNTLPFLPCRPPDGQHHDARALKARRRSAATHLQGESEGPPPLRRPPPDLQQQHGGVTCPPTGAANRMTAALRPPSRLRCPPHTTYRTPHPLSHTTRPHTPHPHPTMHRTWAPTGTSGFCPPSATRWSRRWWRSTRWVGGWGYCCCRLGGGGDGGLCGCNAVLRRYSS